MSHVFKVYYQLYFTNVKCVLRLKLVLLSVSVTFGKCVLMLCIESTTCEMLVDIVYVLSQLSGKNIVLHAFQGLRVFMWSMDQVGHSTGAEEGWTVGSTIVSHFPCLHYTY